MVSIINILQKMWNGGRQPQRRSLTYYLAKAHWKLQKNEQIGFGDSHPKFYSANPCRTSHVIPSFHSLGLGQPLRERWLFQLQTCEINNEQSCELMAEPVKMLLSRVTVSRWPTQGKLNLCRTVIVCPSVRLGLTILKFSYLLVWHCEMAVYTVK